MKTAVVCNSCARVKCWQISEKLTSLWQLARQEQVPCQSVLVKSDKDESDQKDQSNPHLTCTQTHREFNHMQQHSRGGASNALTTEEDREKLMNGVRDTTCYARLFCRTVCIPRRTARLPRSGGGALSGETVGGGAWRCLARTAAPLASRRQVRRPARARIAQETVCERV